MASRDNLDAVRDHEDPGGKQLKREDLLQYSNIFASEFNNSALHDRILVLKVMNDSDGVIHPENCCCEIHKNTGESKNIPSLFERDVHDKDDARESYDREGDDREGDDRKGDDRERKDRKRKDWMRKDREGDDRERKDREYDDRESDDKEGNDREGNDTEGDDTEGDDWELCDGREHLLMNKLAVMMKPELDNSKLPITITEPENTKTDDTNECFTSNNNPFQEHRLFIHSPWLAVQSPYFRALFNSGMRETFSKEITLKVNEDELESHYTLIEAMYKPSILDDKDPYIVLQVLTLANKYDVNLIFKKCKYVLMSVPISLELCESALSTACDMLATEDLIHHMEVFLVNEFKSLDKVWKTDKFKNLSEVSLRILLSSNKLPVLSENTVFVALMHWCEQNDYSGPSLLSLLRPELMTIDFLHDVVYNHHSAKQMSGFDKLLLKGFRYHSCPENRKKILDNEVERRTEQRHDDEEPSYTWQFSFSENNHQSGLTMYKSDHFWWCGYEMMLSLTYKSNMWIIHLYVLNIEDVSCLKIFWEIEVELCPGEGLRRAVTFHDRFEMGCDKMEFKITQPILRNRTYPINIFLRFAATPEDFTLFN